MGIPNLFVSANGRALNSKEHDEFCYKNMIIYSIISPYHSSSNGWDERMVLTTKKVLVKLEDGNYYFDNIQQRMQVLQKSFSSHLRCYQSISR